MHKFRGYVCVCVCVCLPVISISREPSGTSLNASYTIVQSFAGRVASAVSRVDKMPGSRRKTLAFFRKERVKPPPLRYDCAVLSKLVVLLTKVMFFAFKWDAESMKKVYS